MLRSRRSQQQQSALVQLQLRAARADQLPTIDSVHPAAIRDILTPVELDELAGLSLGYGYTDGRPALREAIADWYPGASASNVFVGHGSSEANLLTLMALCDRGDHIVVVVPNFMQIDGLARGLGIDVTQVALRAEDDWQPAISALEAAIRGTTSSRSQRPQPFCHSRPYGSIRLRQNRWRVTSSSKRMVL